MTTEQEHEEMVQRKLYLRSLREYKTTLNHTLATTRFTNFTWQENCRFREKNPHVKCAYTSPVPLSQNILPESLIFVLEMNNDTNHIIGIGLIKNHPIFEKYTIYEVNNYNRFFYFGKWRIGVEDMTRYEKEILKLYEAMCFNGSTHMKRGHGITSFPLSLLYLCSADINLIEFVRDMFKKRMDRNKI
jgi:aconitase A